MSTIFTTSFHGLGHRFCVLNEHADKTQANSEADGKDGRGRKLWLFTSVNNSVLDKSLIKKGYQLVAIDINNV